MSGTLAGKAGRLGLGKDGWDHWVSLSEQFRGLSYSMWPLHGVSPAAYLDFTWQLRYPKVQTWTALCLCKASAGLWRGAFIASSYLLVPGPVQTQRWRPQKVLSIRRCDSETSCPSGCSVISFSVMGEEMSRNQWTRRERHKQHLWWLEGRCKDVSLKAVGEAQVRWSTERGGEVALWAGNRLSLEPDSPWAFHLHKPIKSISSRASWSQFPIYESRGLTNSRQAANHAVQEREALEVTLPLNESKAIWKQPVPYKCWALWSSPMCSCTVTLSRMDSAPDIKKREVCGWRFLTASESPFHVHN